MQIKLPFWGGYGIFWGDAKELCQMNKISQKLKNKLNFKI